MTTIDFERRIAAAPDHVWTVLTDPDRYVAANAALDGIEYLDDTGVGLRRRCIGSDGAVWTERAVAHEDGSHLRLAIDVAESPMHRRFFRWFEGDWRVAPVDDVTRLTLEFDYGLKYGPLGRLLDVPVSRQTRALGEDILTGLRREAERPSRATARDL